MTLSPEEAWEAQRRTDCRVLDAQQIERQDNRRTLLDLAQRYRKEGKLREAKAVKHAASLLGNRK